jgi:enoyl-CoA hydratase/carnithine racemase
VLNAELLSPPEAREIGLIDQVTEPHKLLDEALATAERLARISPDVYAYTKRQLTGPARERIDALSPADDEATTAMWGSPTVLAAIDGFMSGLKQR